MTSTDFSFLPTMSCGTLALLGSVPLVMTICAYWTVLFSIFLFFSPILWEGSIERLEIWDEFEEWNMIQAHYCVAMAVRDPVVSGGVAASVAPADSEAPLAASPVKSAPLSVATLRQVGFLSLDTAAKLAELALLRQQALPPAIRKGGLPNAD